MYEQKRGMVDEVRRVEDKWSSLTKAERDSFLIHAHQNHEKNDSAKEHMRASRKDLIKKNHAVSANSMPNPYALAHRLAVIVSSMNPTVGGGGRACVMTHGYWPEATPRRVGRAFSLAHLPAQSPMSWRCVTCLTRFTMHAQVASTERARKEEDAVAITKKKHEEDLAKKAVRDGVYSHRWASPEKTRVMRQASRSKSPQKIARDAGLVVSPLLPDAPSPYRM